MKSIETLSTHSFKRFGKLLEFSENPQDNRFEVVVEEADSPWRIAVFNVKIKETNTMECHPDSMETFEPISGTGLLLVAEYETPQDFNAFLLDKPICLYKGIWHEVLTLSDSSLYKITENLEVNSEFYHFGIPVKPVILVTCNNNDES